MPVDITWHMKLYYIWPARFQAGRAHRSLHDRFIIAEWQFDVRIRFPEVPKAEEFFPCQARYLNFMLAIFCSADWGGAASASATPPEYTTKNGWALFSSSTPGEK